MAVLMVAAWLGIAAAAVPHPSTTAVPEVYHYQESIGNSTTAVEWRLEKGSRFTLTYLSPLERHVTTTELDYDTRMMHIRLVLPGLLAPFWKSDYWFSLPGGIFFRFQGPSGPPGAPLTTVTRMTAETVAD